MHIVAHHGEHAHIIFLRLFICFYPHRALQASEASREVLAKVAAKCFKVADDTDRAGQATRETGKDFRKAVVM